MSTSSAGLSGRAAAVAAAATANLVGTRRAEAGDPSFTNNVPTRCSPKTSCRPSSSPWRSRRQGDRKSSGKEATVEQLPISKGIAGSP